MITFGILSFIAGVLSVLAPCVIVMIPLLISSDGTGKRLRNPVYIIGGLALSVILFSILLKSTTLLLGVPAATWSIISGIIIIGFGIIMVFPSLWEKINLRLGLSLKAQQTTAGASRHNGIFGDILLGASLGPIFSACSPTYALIVASILPASPVEGMVYLLLFTLGLALMLALIAVGGQALIRKLGWSINPNGLFRRGLGIVLVLLGIFIATGLDKDLLGYLVSNGWFDWQIGLESQFISE